ncbi:MAG: rhomboid family intramembrane serine protease [Bacteroidetes bacterium]|nr:rhomboid family intramembrane serine protease [Bacteroidota bacterium]
MRSSLDNIKSKFGAATSLYRLLIVNIGLFLALMILRTFLFILGSDFVIFDFLVEKLSMPASFSQLIFQPWSVVTYMFLHIDFMHILFNMLILYWTGSLFSEYLGNEKLWTTYVLGAITGGLAYLIMFNLSPAFSHQINHSHLMGASAGVIAVMVGIATLLPDYTVQLILIGPVKLKYVALVSILIYFISIPLGNAGGQIAHLGGALFGYIMIKQLKKGNDITSWLSNLFKKRSSRKSKMTVVRSGKPIPDTVYVEAAISKQEAIDKVLDKINKSGFDSLSKEEKEILYNASGKSNK